MLWIAWFWFVCPTLLSTFGVNSWHRHHIMWFGSFTALLNAWGVLAFFSDFFSSQASPPPSTHQTSAWMRTIWEQRVKRRSLNESPTPQHKTLLPLNNRTLSPPADLQETVLHWNKASSLPPTISRATWQPSMKWRLSVTSFSDLHGTYLAIRNWTP